MDKKDIYEHLAKIYLDASSTKKKKRIDPRILRSLTLAMLAAVFLEDELHHVALEVVREINVDVRQLVQRHALLVEETAEIMQ